MSLSKCQDCGNSVSDSAAECPTCGRQFIDISVKQRGLASMTGGELVFVVTIGGIIVVALIYKFLF